MDYTTCFSLRQDRILKNRATGHPDKAHITFALKTRQRKGNVTLAQFYPSG